MSDLVRHPVSRTEVGLRPPNTRLLIGLTPTTDISQTITGSLFAKAPTFYSGTVSPGPVTITGALFTKAPTFYAGNLFQDQFITGALFSKAPTFFAGTVTLGSGPQTITGAVFQKAPTFFGGKLDLKITGTLFSKSPTFFAGQIVRVTTISGALFAKAPTFFSGTVTPKYTITGVTFTKAGTFFGGTITGGAATITGALFVKAPTFYQGLISIGTLGIPVKGPTRKRITGGSGFYDDGELVDMVYDSEASYDEPALAGPNDSEELVTGSPRSVPIGAGRNSLVEV